MADSTKSVVLSTWPDRPRERLLTFKAVSERVSLKRTAIYAGINERTFPAPVKYGTRSLWVESEIDAWIAKLKASRQAAQPNLDDSA